MSHPGSTNGSATAADVLGPLLRRQVADLRTREVEVRLGEPDAVHRFRVAARRLRSHLAAFGSFLDPVVCQALEDELAEVAAVVGGARDADVARRRVDSLLQDEPDSPAATEVRARLVEALEASYAESWQRAIDYLDGPTYDAFTRRLDGFADLPPWAPTAEVSAAAAFVPVLRQLWSRLLKQGRAVQLLEPGPRRDEQLHDVRKAAKRVRDVAETQTPMLGRRARRLRKAAQRLQEVLGEYQDLVVTRTALVDAGRAGADGSRVVDRMSRRESAAAGDLYDEFVRLFRDADRKSLRAWLS